MNASLFTYQNDMAGRESQNSNAQEFQIGVHSDIGKDVAAGAGVEAKSENAEKDEAEMQKLQQDRDRTRAEVAQRKAAREGREAVMKIADAAQIDQIRSGLGLTAEKTITAAPAESGVVDPVQKDIQSREASAQGRADKDRTQKSEQAALSAKADTLEDKVDKMLAASGKFDNAQR